MIALEKDINFEKKTTIKAAVKQIYHQEVHYHSNAIEMIFCLQGSISMRSSHRHVTLYEGDVFSIDPGDIHCIYSDTDNLVLFIHINIYIRYILRKPFTTVSSRAKRNLCPLFKYSQCIR